VTSDPCANGCQSDNNCADNQHCVLCGSKAVGVCRNCSDTTDVCGATTDAGPHSSPNACQRNNGENQPACGPTGPSTSVAYDCPPDQQPLQRGCIQSPVIPTTYCCPQ
jgi:hypothetical protein